MANVLEAWLPVANTSLIVVSGFFLGLGWLFIRRRHIQAHHRSMITASIFAGLFLVVYVARYLMYEPQIFAGEGWVRGVYLGILGSHIILAIALGPMVLITLRRALRSDFLRHRRLARITAPVWAYVAVTGWIIYLMLHHLPA